MSLKEYASVALVFDKRHINGELIPRACIVPVDEDDDRYAILSKAERYCKEVHLYKDAVKGLLVVGSDYSTFEVNE